jgi:hypothetical protein
MSTSSVGRDWDRQFGFLKAEGMHHVYLALMTLARSARDIERLHTLLPDNCRLLQDDLRAFKDFWVSQCNPTTSERKERLLLDSAVEWLLERECSGKSLRQYYARRLLAGRAGNSDDPELDIWNHRIYLPSWRYRQGSELHGNFVVTLHGMHCLTYCSLSRDQQQLLVQICIPTLGLTEAITHKLLSMPPAKWWCYQEGEVPYQLMLDAGPFLNLVQPGSLWPLPEMENLVTTETLAQVGYHTCVLPAFPEQLKRSLESIGIPVTTVHREHTPIEKTVEYNAKLECLLQGTFKT